MNLHKCLVCDGQGLVPTGFYSGFCPGQNDEYTGNAITALEICRACNGQGIIWEKGEGDSSAIYFSFEKSKTQDIVERR